METVATLEEPRSVKKQVIVAFSVMLVVIALLGLVKYIQISRAIAQSASFAPPPETVTSSIAKLERWQDTFTAVGSLKAHQGVTLSAETGGTVERILFESGNQVAAGDLLIVLDTRVEQGELEGALARQSRARSAFVRTQQLIASNAVSKDRLEEAESAFRQASAEVQALEAIIARKKIIAPFPGRTGIRLVNVGQYVQSGTPIVPLYDLKQLYLDFFVPQRLISEIAEGQKVRLAVDAFPDRVFDATVSAVNPQIDPVTRNIAIRATLVNENEVLRPGMFAKVTLILPHVTEVITLPGTSISFAPYGDSVYVIEKMKDPQGNEYQGARQQIVQIGSHRGELVSILSGITAGQEIVSSGIFKIRPGAPVVVDNSIVPGSNPAPKPADT